MGRIQNAYEAKLRVLLGQLHARRPDQGVQWLLHRAQQLSQREGISGPQSLAQVYEGTRRQVEQWQKRRSPSPRGSTLESASAPPRFLCDGGLGGLARWLRAAGYEAKWTPGLDDDDLLQEARCSSAILLTTDSMLMERRVLRDRILPALWVPPTMSSVEQLAVVLRDLRLPLRESRCMSCGGRLGSGDKEALRERIPPRTYRWLDEYLVCQDCGKLFWHGTHWNRIRAQLQKLGN